MVFLTGGYSQLVLAQVVDGLHNDLVSLLYLDWIWAKIHMSDDSGFVVVGLGYANIFVVDLEDHLVASSMQMTTSPDDGCVCQDR
jgi:hypothetical protein